MRKPLGPNVPVKIKREGAAAIDVNKDSWLPQQASQTPSLSDESSKTLASMDIDMIDAFKSSCSGLEAVVGPKGNDFTNTIIPSNQLDERENFTFSKDMPMNFTFDDIRRNMSDHNLIETTNTTINEKDDHLDIHNQSRMFFAAEDFGDNDITDLEEFPDGIDPYWT
jgi:hypothetical protein